MSKVKRDSQIDEHVLTREMHVSQSVTGKPPKSLPLQQEFKLLADHAPVMIWIADSNKKCFYFNSSWLAFTGRSYDQEKGEGWLVNIHPADKKTYLDKFSAAIESRTEFVIEYRLKRHDNTYRWVLNRGVPVFDSDHQFAGFIGSGIDISDRRNKEDENRLLFQALEQTADAVFITDQRGIITYVNQAFENITQYDKSEVLGKTPNIIKSDKHDKEFYRRLWRTILKGGVYRDIIINRKKNGELFYADHTITPIKDEANRIISFVANWKDITKQVQVEQQKDRFLGIVSHELKTPVTSLKALAQMLERSLNKKGDYQSAEYVHKIENQTNKLIKLITDLVEITQLEKETIKFNFEEFNLEALVRDTVELMRLTTAHTLKLEATVSNTLVFADKHRTEQVLMNLISNAIKYSPSGDPVTITCSESEEMVKICVIDKGIGISIEDQAQLFRRFYRVENEKSKNIHGIGLGLFISAEIIHRQNGKIWVQSEENKGSTFCFALPKPKPHPETNYEPRT